MSDRIQVLTTVGSEAGAERVAATEWRCLAKTERRLVLAGSPGYLAWVAENLRPPGV